MVQFVLFLWIKNGPFSAELWFFFGRIVLFSAELWFFFVVAAPLVGAILAIAQNIRIRCQDSRVFQFGRAWFRVYS
ncbi:hypothetical protein EDC26_105117 [Paralcaligenes ureilyticus]|uniref:Uncharacterized protein n=1 Tax=Paralcaligenes ureilyticus TaxID=627131 RepID=A0A4R3M6G5_9BURK|nr:hypothetical protein EDC26_105117 [Paralcaligenes ureilyticus]